jgi:hypothetical protein
MLKFSAPLANAAWWLAGAPSAAAFNVALADPARAQEHVLRDLLRRNASTAYGREHGFADIRNVEQFARRVPPCEYDALHPWVERIRTGEQNVLTAAPVRRLVPTSGSTAARKLIPYTASMQSELNRAIGPWIFDLYRRHPGAARGPAYWSVTPVAQQAEAPTKDSAVPIGFDDDADYLGGWRKGLVSAAMAVPPPVASITSIDDWRYVTLLHLLRRRDLALVSVWHPSFLELLLDDLRRDWELLLRDVSSGGCTVSSRVPAHARPLRARAEELRRAGPRDVSRIWPGLSVVSCWADGNAAGAAAALRQRIQKVVLQPKGLLATEGVVSIPYGGLHPLAVRSHFLEFEDESGRVRVAADVCVGKRYTVLLTTGGGLYRYRLQDLVEVDGRVGHTPSIRFIGKAASVSDRMGEKLTDGFVAQVLAALFAPGTRPSFAMLAPEAESGQWRYVLYLNAPVGPMLADRLDAMLSGNPQYAYCRRLGQLDPAETVLVPGDAYGRYANRLRRAGQRMGDIKPASLSPLDGWSAVFSDMVVPDRCARMLPATPQTQ